MKIINTEAGKAVLIKKLTKLVPDDGGTTGSIGLFILTDVDVFCLLWEWGGDWMSFGDGDENQIECLRGWEPDAIREAVRETEKFENDDLDGDMEWFLNWADTANNTLDCEDEDEEE
jgi:hypothetical protein